MEYRMIDGKTLSNFRRFMASGIPLSEFGPAGAFDAKPKRRARLAMDEADADTAKKLLKAICRMSPDEFAEFQSLLRRYAELDSEEEGEDDEDTSQGMLERPQLWRDTGEEIGAKAKDKRRMGRDDPPAFPGRPRTGGEMDPLAGDAASFASRYPDAMRCKPGAIAHDSARPLRMKQWAKDSFAERYPEAAHIKIGGF